jgi:hypothetical protein
LIEQKHALVLALMLKVPFQFPTNKQDHNDSRSCSSDNESGNFRHKTVSPFAVIDSLGLFPHLITGLYKNKMARYIVDSSLKLSLLLSAAGNRQFSMAFGHGG